MTLNRNFINSIDHIYQREIFRCTTCSDIRQKIIDIEAQQIDYESSGQRKRNLLWR